MASGSAPTVTTVVSLADASSGMNSLSEGISGKFSRCSADVSGGITRKCVLSDTGIDTGQTGGGSGFTGRKEGWKRREEEEDTLTMTRKNELT